NRRTDPQQHRQHPRNEPGQPSTPIVEGRFRSGPTTPPRHSAAARPHGIRAAASALRGDQGIVSS
ncbi:hypothetical protein, partial [Mycolicibacter heraklionensis]|uniref:hypothetical protein n=1 Tax=Mycolicibacter heraklionensis TaxID=512402 RepID=UPI001F33766D